MLLVEKTLRVVEDLNWSGSVEKEWTFMSCKMKQIIGLIISCGG